MYCKNGTPLGITYILRAMCYGSGENIDYKYTGFKRKKVIARTVLEGLKEWFEVEETTKMWFSEDGRLSSRKSVRTNYTYDKNGFLMIWENYLMDDHTKI